VMWREVVRREGAERGSRKVGVVCTAI
jgi:hypothetical protein